MRLGDWGIGKLEGRMWDGHAQSRKHGKLPASASHRPGWNAGLRRVISKKTLMFTALSKDRVTCWQSYQLQDALVILMKLTKQSRNGEMKCNMRRRPSAWGGR
jgi:hypothetical protein